MKFATFTFDDGAINSAYKVDTLLSPYKATFYITTGWVKPFQVPIGDRFNQSVDHGSVETWHYLAKKGHDIGSHTVTHIRGNHPNIKGECLDSFRFIQCFQEAPYSFSCPHHTVVETFLYNTVRTGPFETVNKTKFSKDKIYNNLDRLNMYRLYCYDPLDKNDDLLNDLPDNIWLIFAFHGIDNEGFVPVSSERLSEYKNIVLKNGFEIKSMRDMTLLYGGGGLWHT